MTLYLSEDTICALGGGRNITRVALNGQASNTGTTENPIWDAGGGSSYAQMTAGTALEVLSSSASDTSAGTGARTITVEGLDSNYTQFTETVTLNGTTPVALSNNSAVAVNKAYVATAGSGLTNAGTITIRTVSGSVTKTRLSQGSFFQGTTFDFIYTIPANYTGLLSDIHIGSTALVADLTVCLNTYSSTGIRKTVGISKISQSNTGFNPGIGIIYNGRGLQIPEKTLIVLTGRTSTGSAFVTAQAELLLIKKNTITKDGVIIS